MNFTKDNCYQIIKEKYDQHSSENFEGTWSKKGFESVNSQENYLNFFLNNLRRGLVESPEKKPHKTPYSDDRFSIKFYFKNYLLKKIFRKKIKNNFKKNFEVFRSLGLKFPLYKDVYKNFYFNFDNHSYNSNIEKYSSFLEFIKKNIDLKRVGSCCEIGAGYGGMIELMILNSSVRNYIIIDLFETLSISMLYICNNISNNFNFYFIEKSDELGTIDYKTKNIIFLSEKSFNEELRKEIKKKLNINLFINTNSMVEMKKKNINDYFSFIESFDNTIFFNSNSILRKEQNESLSAYNLPFDESWIHLDERVEKKYNDLTRISKRNIK